MKQKITLEIQNDTGLEFEDTTKWDCPKEGEYFINSRHKIEKSDRFSSCYHYVLTPKVDHELEEAKKLIGKWVYNTFRGNSAIRVERVYRDESDGVIWYANESSSVSSISWKHFFLPTWRCCESDKPNTCDKRYFIRSKDKSYKNTQFFYDECFHLAAPSLYEWLDEGGE